ncbi:MAG: hypothetical protein ACK417_01925 [Bacteroidia bacterium]
MSIKPSIFWYAISLLLLVHVQMNLHQFAYFIGAAVIIGLFPIRDMRWWKYAGLELLALLFMLIMNRPEAATLDMLSRISGFSGTVLVGITMVLSTISFVLVAQSTQVWVTRLVFARYLGLK